MFAMAFGIILAYLVGSIPSGYWFSKYFFGMDITKKGSGNIGATNVARVLGSKKYFFLIFFVDFLKAFLFLFVLSRLSGGFLLACAAMLLVGNGYSVFIRFRGGKGVATSLGILLFFFPLLFFIFILSWGTALLVFRRVDVSCLLSTTLLLPFYFICQYPADLLTITFLILMVIWIFVRHRSNIKVLI